MCERKCTILNLHDLRNRNRWLSFGPFNGRCFCFVTCFHHIERADKKKILSLSGNFCINTSFKMAVCLHQNYYFLLLYFFLLFFIPATRTCPKFRWNLAISRSNIWGINFHKFESVLLVQPQNSCIEIFSQNYFCHSVRESKNMSYHQFKKQKIITSL